MRKENTRSRKNVILEISLLQESQISTVIGKGEYRRLRKGQSGAVARITEALIPKARL
jgi:hypothetical protein